MKNKNTHQQFTLFDKLQHIQIRSLPGQLRNEIGCRVIFLITKCGTIKEVEGKCYEQIWRKNSINLAKVDNSSMKLEGGNNRPK